MGEEHDADQSRCLPGIQSGVFETIRVDAGRALELELHQERLAAAFRACFGSTAPELRALVERALVDAPRDAELLRWDFPAAEAATWSHAWRRRSPSPVPLRVALAHEPRLEPASRRILKQRDRSWVDRHRRADVDETLVWDREHGVLEGLRSNLFVDDGRRWRTPPVSAGLVPGVVRERLLRCAAGAGVELVEAPIECGELEGARALYLSGSGLGLVRARLGSGGRVAEGGALERLRRALRAWRGAADEASG